MARSSGFGGRECDLATSSVFASARACVSRDSSRHMATSWTDRSRGALDVSETAASAGHVPAGRVRTSDTHLTRCSSQQRRVEWPEYCATPPALPHSWRARFPSQHTFLSHSHRTTMCRLFHAVPHLSAPLAAFTAGRCCGPGWAPPAPPLRHARAGADGGRWRAGLARLPARARARRLGVQLRDFPSSSGISSGYIGGLVIDDDDGGGGDGGGGGDAGAHPPGAGRIALCRPHRHRHCLRRPKRQSRTCDAHNQRCC